MRRSHRVGNDVINARLGNDLVFGGANFDTISAGEGQDTVFGGDGRDLVFLNQGNDLFNDNAQGGVNGQDTVFGGFGNDTIEGGNGSDQFFGEDGADVINGRPGNDTIGGGAGKRGTPTQSHSSAHKADLATIRRASRPLIWHPDAMAEHYLETARRMEGEKLEPRFYRFPSPSVLLKFSHVAEWLYLSEASVPDDKCPFLYVP